MRGITLDALLIVDAIDRRGSFSAASEELHKVPSAVSYAVSKLERDLGVKLFKRHGPRATLTAAGDELLKEGRELLKLAADLECRVRRVATGWETEFRIVLDSLFAPTVLASDLDAFFRESAGSRISVLTATLSGCWEALLDGRADLILATGEGPAGGGYDTLRLGEISFVFCVAPFHPLAKATQPVALDALRAHKAVVVADSARRLPARTIGVLNAQDTLTVSDMHVKLQLQIWGMGFGFLPWPCASAAIERGELVVLEVDTPRAPETVSIAWRRHARGNALQWWRARLAEATSFERLIQSAAF